MIRSIRGKRYNFIFRNIIFNLVKIETSAICNARCVWCWMYNANKIKPGLMSFDSYKKIIDMNIDFFQKGNWHIEPFFKGEALLNPQLFEMLDYTVERKIKLTPRFDTNLSVRFDIAKFMRFPWQKICVNIGGVTKEVHEKVMKNTDFTLVVKNLKKMLKINRDIVYIKMNATKYNIHQYDMLKEFFEGLGGKRENIRYYNTGFNLSVLATPKEKRYFFDNVVSEKVKPYLRFEYHLTKQDYVIQPKNPGCRYLIICITVDGRVTLCCHDLIGAINVGNAFRIPLRVILDSKLYRETKEKCINQEFCFCKECN